MFKVGDEVVCIYPQRASGEQIPRGYRGKVTDIDGLCIAVDGKVGYHGSLVMHAEAFQLVELATQAKVKAKRVKIPCYAVIKGAKVIYTTSDREDARAVKSARGGKACGVSIYKMAAEKEIR